MAEAAEWAIGDAMEYGDGATPTEGFTEIDGIKDINFNLGSRTLVNTTTHQSTPPHPDNVATFLEGGSITLAGNNLPENVSQRAVAAMRDDDLPTTFRYVQYLANGHIVRNTGKGRVTSFNPNSNADDARRLQISIAPTGGWVETTET